MDTTNISDLPTSAQSKSADAPNIVLGIKQNEKVDNPIQSLQAQRNLDMNPPNGMPPQGVGGGGEPPLQMPQMQQMPQKQMNQVVNGIQQAIASGATSLPSRDIPQETQQIMQDPEVKPNFVPPPPQMPPDYIRQYETNQEIIRNNRDEERKQNTMDSLYEEVQVPVLLAVLYFFFQLPFFREKFFQFIPSFFNKDGNPKVSANIVNSILFAVLFYLLQKGMQQLSQM